jgi:hypothetical protein
MAKKASKKKGVKKKTKIRKTRSPKKVVSSQKVQIEMQPVLVENFVSLQRVMVNLSTKFETLNKQLSDLLKLFEMSAKALAKKDFKFGQTESNREVVEKLNELTEQNKIIAKGLTMIHEDEQEQKQMIVPPAIPAQLETPKKVPVKTEPTKKPKMPSFPPLPKAEASAAPQQKPKEEYQKSASEDKTKSASE